MNTPCKSACMNDEELISYYPESDYWQTVHEQQSLYDYAANNQKKEQFIKSPLIIYNHCYVKGALEVAYQLRCELEEAARRQPLYIRPIVLFIVPSENFICNSLVELKQQFIADGIPAAEIRIRSNTLDELINEDLRSEYCNVRYVITTADLKQPWRCSFAYILVSMTERNVTQDLIHVLNGMLPQPYAISHSFPLLNAGYILTVSSHFEEIQTSVRLHLEQLGITATELVIKDNLIELLKRVSVFEILRGEKYGLQGLQFDSCTVDSTVTTVMEDIKKLIGGGSRPE